MSVSKGEAAPGLHGGDVWTAAVRYQRPAEGFIDFSANINPAGPPAGVLAALQGAGSGDIARYPEPFARTLAAELAAVAGVPPAALLVGNGAAEVIYLFTRLAAGRPVLVPAPAFAEYPRAAAAAGSPVVTFPLDPARDFRFDVDALGAAAVRAQAGLVVLSNPHNPSGTVLPAADLYRLARRLAGEGTWLLVDEAFIDFMADPETASLIRAAAQTPFLAVVRSLTKFYALPGLRIGYGVAQPQIIARLNGQRDPWSVSALAQTAARAALADSAYAASTRAWILAERPWLHAALAELPRLRPYPPGANFILVDAMATGKTAAALQNYLGPRGLLIRDCADFLGLSPFHFRTAVRSRVENERLVATLREVLT
ncbi:MAG: threonine-phosphate decarboxylase CobD [Symbiobacteriia bacterium]